jgi:hypothetical protein
VEIKIGRYSGTKLISESESSFSRFLGRGSFHHYLGFFYFPGIRECLALLKLRHYKEEQESEKLLVVRILEFINPSNEKVTEKYLMFSAPATEFGSVISVSKEVRMTLVRGSTSNTRKYFPGKNTYLLILPDSHPYNRGDYLTRMRIWSGEERTLKIIGSHVELPRLFEPKNEPESSNQMSNSFLTS